MLSRIIFKCVSEWLDHCRSGLERRRDTWFFPLDKRLSRVFKGETGFEFWLLRFRFWGASFSSFGCLVFRFWVLRFQVLGASFSSLGCSVFEIWVLRFRDLGASCFGLRFRNYLLRTRFSLSVSRESCDVQISQEMVSNAHVHQLTVSLKALWPSVGNWCGFH